MAERPELHRLDLGPVRAYLLKAFDALTAIHAPGHRAGQVVVLWEPAGVLIAADAAPAAFRSAR